MSYEFFFELELEFEFDHIIITQPFFR